MGRRLEKKIENINNLIQLLLANPQGLRRAEIARRLGVHRATAAEYLDELGALGIPVFEPVPERFAIVREDYEIEVSLTMHESLALHLATRLLTTRTDKFNPHAASAVRKLGQELAPLAPLISQHMQRSADVMDGLYRRRDPVFLQVLETLTRAWSLGCKVQLTHEMDTGEVYEYRFAPYYIEPYAPGRTLHVIGFREPPGAIRTFKVERIRTITLLEDQPYTIPDDYDPHLSLQDAWGIWISEKDPQLVQLAFSSEVARRVHETVWHESQQLYDQNDGGVLWEAHISEPKEMLPWIRGWGAEVEVLRPEWLRRALVRESWNLAQIYSPQAEMCDHSAYYAHSKDGLDEMEWQYLKDHLLETGKWAYNLGKDAGIAELARTAGYLHDLGKYSSAFQERLHGAPRKVDHASAGAREVLSLFTEPRERLFAELLSYCIAGHHSGIPDYGSVADMPTDGTLIARRDKKELEDYSAYHTELDESLFHFTPPTIQINREHPGFSISFLTRMLYSTLTDADWLETEQYMQGVGDRRGGSASIPDLAAQFNRYLQRFDHPQNEINRKRSETLHSCLNMSNQEPGFFSLTVPTGGGKTFASMAFALNHAQQHGLQRVIYVIPFTSIIEQNVAVFRGALGPLGEENLLEHHSNYDWDRLQPSTDDETNRVSQKLKRAAENWDLPIVVTTNVQFFESLFANKKSGARKLHNIAKSVIIFDEVQMLPRDYLKPSMLAVQELVTNYGASVVFCTATQPALDRFFPERIEFKELVEDPVSLYDFYRRVTITDLQTQSDAELLNKLQHHSQVLCIVNTRRHAKSLFEGLEEEGRFHLSTLMCPVHRRKVLAEIQARLKSGKVCRVISTQVMEAGIDIDFPVGYRAMAGLDSIIQASGRINREGTRPQGEMYVFEPQTDCIRRTPIYIKQTASVAESVLRQHAQDPVSLAAVSAYYQLLYALHDDESFDARGVLRHLDKGANRLDFEFATAAEKFKLIDNQTMAVFVPYDDEAKQLLVDLQYVRFPASVLRRLQVYSVNIYEHEYQALQSKGVIQVINEQYPVLDPDWMGEDKYYHPESGLLLVERVGGDALFFE